MKKAVLMSILILAAAALSAQNKTALVIGNGAYKNDFLPLSKPVPEARQMADALESIGFKVIRAYNVQNQDRFYSLFEMFENDVRERGGIALFHYGGHGVQVNGENYLLPTETDIPNEIRARTRGISVSEVTAAIESSSPDTSVIILDACRNNPFGRGGERGLARIKPPRNSLVVYAADAGESASDGLFTPTLLKYLTRPGWSLNQVLQRTRSEVLSISGGKQSPGEYSQLLSDVYLAGRSGAAAPEAPDIGFAVKQSYGSLEVSTRTAGALYLNGKSVGRVPAGSSAALGNIPVGAHDLEMRYGGQTERKRVTVRQDRAVSVAFSWVERPEAPENFVRVEGGRFRMGSPPSESGRDDDETQHEVRVSSFYMSRYEVTHGQYLEFLNGAGVSAAGRLNGNEVIDMDDDDVAFSHNGTRFRFSGSGYADSIGCPVIEVTWYGAVEYANWRSEKEGLKPVYRINGSNVGADWSANGYRLPTEVEWEYAARGGNSSNGYKYAGGHSPGEVAWYDDNSGGKTRPVGRKAPNELGLYDMSGNVWEWCWDWYGSYSSGSQSDPGGPASGSYRVYRGGSWLSSARGLRSANRDGNSPGNSYGNLGFRLVRREF